MCSSVDARVLVYTLRTRTRPETHVRAQNRLGSPVCGGRGYLDSISPPRYLLCVVANQVSPRWESDSRLISSPHSEQRCVKLFGDFCGTSARRSPIQASSKFGWKLNPPETVATNCSFIFTGCDIYGPLQTLITDGNDTRSIGIHKLLGDGCVLSVAAYLRQE